MKTSLLFAAIAVLVGVRPLAADPYHVDFSGNGLSWERTICGENEMVNLIDEEDETLKSMGRPIGIYRFETDTGASLCSGTLIGKDLFLTAHHCLDRSDADACSHISVKFGYLSEGDRSETFRCQEIVDPGGASLDQDFLLIRLEGSPGVNWGWYPPSDRALSTGDRLLMIHHPRAMPMKVSKVEKCQVMELSGGFLHHRCDTESGSSGGGILLPDYERPENTRVVGVHTLGGCTSSPTSTNSGPAIRHLVEKSEALKKLVLH